MIEGHPVWSGRAKHAYGHLLFTDIEEGTYQIEQLQITNPEVIPHGIRCEGLRKATGSGQKIPVDLLDLKP